MDSEEPHLRTRSFEIRYKVGSFPDNIEGAIGIDANIPVDKEGRIRVLKEVADIAKKLIVKDINGRANIERVYYEVR